MFDALERVFALVCAQAPDHTWMPGGAPLPFCQRCTGLYVGASLAFLLRWVVNLRSDRRLDRVDGLLLLQMVPFGYHWLPQGPLLRTASGLLFAFGLVGFLSLLPRARLGLGHAATRGRTSTLAGSALAGAAAVLLLASRGGPAAGRFLAVVGLLGLAVLTGLAAANVVLSIEAAVRGLPRRLRGSCGS